MGAGVQRGQAWGVGLWAEAWFCPQEAQYVELAGSFGPLVTPMLTSWVTTPPTTTVLRGMGYLGHPHPQLEGLLLSFPTGLFEPADMKYNVQQDHTKDPTLEEIAEAALQVLSRNPQGFTSLWRVSGSPLLGTEA